MFHQLYTHPVVRGPKPSTQVEVQLHRQWSSQDEFDPQAKVPKNSELTAIMGEVGGEGFESPLLTAHNHYCLNAFKDEEFGPEKHGKLTKLRMSPNQYASL